MPADGISAATRERGLRYVAVFWQLAWPHGEPNVSYKGSELKGFARSIWSGIELARMTARGTFPRRTSATGSACSIRERWAP